VHTKPSMSKRKITFSCLLSDST